MTKTQEKKRRDKRRKKIRRIKRISIVVLIVLSFIFLRYAYHRIFYSETDALVLYSESKIVGPRFSQFGSVPVSWEIIGVEFTDHSGVKYSTEIDVGELRDLKVKVKAESMVRIKYKNSDPEKCYFLGKGKKK